MGNRFLSLQQELGKQHVKPARFAQVKTVPGLKKRSQAATRSAVAASSSIFKYLTHGQSMGAKEISNPSIKNAPGSTQETDQEITQKIDQKIGTKSNRNTIQNALNF